MFMGRGVIRDVDVVPMPISVPVPNTGFLPGVTGDTVVAQAKGDGNRSAALGNEEPRGWMPAGSHWVPARTCG